MLTQPFFLKFVLFSPRLSPRGSCWFQGYVFLLATHFHFKRTSLYPNFLCLTLYAEVSHGILYAAVLHIALHQFFHLHDKHSWSVLAELLNHLCISPRIAQQSPCSLWCSVSSAATPTPTKPGEPDGSHCPLSHCHTCGHRLHIL